MKKLSIFLLGTLLFLGLSGNVFAQFDREHHATDAGYVNVVSRANDGVLSAAPVFIYAATLQATSSNAIVYIYDNASAASGTIKVEIAEPTSGTSKRVVFSTPIQMINGAYADVTNGSVDLEYR